VALRSADGRLFVGPDNGLLVPAAEASGGIELAVSITEPRFMLEHVSHTFHGRDVFGPVAGHQRRWVRSAPDLGLYPTTGAGRLLG